MPAIAANAIVKPRTRSSGSNVSKLGNGHAISQKAPAASAKQSAPKIVAADAPVSAKKAAVSARTSSATFLNLCRQEKFVVPASASAVTQYLADHHCNTILGESAAAAKERAAAICWTLRRHSNPDACKNLSPTLVAVLKTLYGKKVRYSDNATTAYSVGSYYHATVGSLPPSDEDSSDADNAGPPAAGAPVVVVNLTAPDPLHLVRPSAAPAPVAPITPPTAAAPPPPPPVGGGATLTQPTSMPAVQPSAASVACAWPAEIRDNMDLTDTYSAEEWKRADKASKGSDKRRTPNSAEQPLQDLIRWSEAQKLPFPNSSLFTGLRAGRALYRQTRFFSQYPVAYTDRARASTDLKERAELARRMRTALPITSSGDNFWEVEQCCILFITDYFRERADAIDLVIAKYGSPEIGQLTRLQMTEFPRFLAAFKRHLHQVAPDNEQDRRNRAFALWDPFLCPDRHFGDGPAAARELRAVVSGQPHASRRARRRSSSSSDDLEFEPAPRRHPSGRKRLLFDGPSQTQRVVQQLPPPYALPPPSEPSPDIASPPISRDHGVYLPCSTGTCGKDLGTTFLVTAPCRHPGCPAGSSDKPPFAYHIRSECPLRFAQITGEPMPGWDRHGLMQPGDWIGDRQPGFPLGPNLSPAAKLRWRALIARFHLVPHDRAPPGITADSFNAPRGSGGGHH